MALIGAGGLSHWIGNPRVGDIEEDFDRWFLERLERGELDQVLDMPDEEIELAGNGNHEMRSWLAVAGAMAPTPAPCWPTSRSTPGSPAWGWRSGSPPDLTAPASALPDPQRRTVACVPKSGSSGRDRRA